MNFQFTYLPDPGISYDVGRMLYVKLNPLSIWKETLTTVEHQEEHIRIIEEHAKLFPEPDSDLSLFVYTPTNKNTTFLSSVTKQLISEGFSEYTISDLISYFENPSKIRNEVLSFYIGEQCLESSNFEYHLRTNRNIPDRIKLLLFGFSYNPKAYTTKLINTINEYYSIISSWVSFEKLSSDELTQFVNIMFDKNSITSNPTDKVFTFPYSLCQCTPVLILCGYSATNPFFVSTICSIKGKKTQDLTVSRSNLLELIHALDDPYRIDIIQLLKHHDGLSPTEIAERISLSLTATKYHLSILKKTNLIKLHRNSRYTYYHYDPSGCRTLLSILENFEKGDIKL